MKPDELDRRFEAHEVGEARSQTMGLVRVQAHDLARLIDASQPDSREKSLAITALEEAVFWANAGISRNGADGPAELFEVPDGT